MTKRIQIWTDKNSIAHRIAPGAHRVAICGEITGIMFRRLTREQAEALENKCEVCWEQAA